METRECAQVDCQADGAPQVDLGGRYARAVVILAELSDGEPKFGFIVAALVQFAMAIAVNRFRSSALSVRCARSMWALPRAV
jgi:hypothetical protein